jgi:hypothetical protein
MHSSNPTYKIQHIMEDSDEEVQSAPPLKKLKVSPPENIWIGRFKKGTPAYDFIVAAISLRFVHKRWAWLVLGTLGNNAISKLDELDNLCRLHNVYSEAFRRHMLAQYSSKITRMFSRKYVITPMSSKIGSECKVRIVRIAPGIAVLHSSKRILQHPLSLKCTGSL